MDIGLIVAAALGSLLLAGWLLEEHAHRLPREWKHELGLLDLEEPTTEDEIAMAYATGRITLAEHERRMAYYIDGRNEQIKQLVTPIPGIDDAIGRGLAAKFETAEELENASTEELRAVHGIGPKRAEAIRERLD